MRIAITGCTSGLGKRLVEFLIIRGHPVKALVRKTTKISELDGPGLEFVYGDITDPVSLKDLVRNVDLCYHIAAQVSFVTKEELFLTNVEGTRNICETIVSRNLSCHMIYCSSIATLPINPYRKFLYSEYSQSKYEAERVVVKYQEEHGLKATIICPGYIYGPYDRNFLPNIITSLKKGIPFLIKGGEKNAPLVYVDDLCELFYLAGNKKVAIGKKYLGVKNIILGIHDAIRIIAKKVDMSYPDKIYPRLPLACIAFGLEKIFRLFRIRNAPPLNMRAVRFLSANFKGVDDLAYKELGWTQRVLLEDGLGMALQWYKTNP